MTEILLIFFSFIAIDEQTTAVSQSTCGVHHVAVNFVFKLNIVISQFARKKSITQITCSPTPQLSFLLLSDVTRKSKNTFEKDIASLGKKFLECYIRDICIIFQ